MSAALTVRDATTLDGNAIGLRAVDGTVTELGARRPLAVRVTMSSTRMVTSSSPGS